MKALADIALNRAEILGATYADARVIDTRERLVSTRNGTVGNVASSESLGIGIRVIAGGAWGFAATDDLTPPSIEAAATRAISTQARALDSLERVRGSARSASTTRRGRTRRSRHTRSAT